MAENKELKAFIAALKAEEKLLRAGKDGDLSGLDALKEQLAELHDRREEAFLALSDDAKFSRKGALLEDEVASLEDSMDLVAEARDVFEEEDVPMETLCEESADILLEVLDFVGDFC